MSVESVHAPGLRYAGLPSEEIERLAASFSSAKPFRHVVLDDFVTASPSELSRSFPDPSWDGWQRYSDAYQPAKMICSDISKIPPPFSTMIHELNSPPFLEFLENITGIKSLIPDPYLSGGGLHCSGPGGVLTPHADFHIYSRLGLFRQINVLLYLNEHWTEEDGGYLELWPSPEAAAPEKIVVPAFGRCVVFKTDDRSIHGFSTPIREGCWRKSVALYYYTSTDPEAGNANRTTYWTQHGALSGAKKARLRVAQGLLGASRGLTFVANRVNPNIGFRRVRAK